MNKFGLVIFFTIHCAYSFSQYSEFPGHSHNDYEQKSPFFDAWNLDYHSIEIDIYEWNGKLIVSHLPFRLKKKPTIEELYFSEKVLSRTQSLEQTSLTYLIDIKNKPQKTLELLHHLKEKYKEYIFDECSNPEGNIRFVLTGKIPLEHLEGSHLCYVFLDGRLHQNYSKEWENKIVMYSFAFKSFKREHKKNWMLVLHQTAKQTQEKEKHLRIWGIPNKKKIWKILLENGVSIINVDHLKAFREFYQKRNKSNGTNLLKK